MSDLTPITRKEKIISGEDLKPITREEMFLQKYRGSGGGGGTSVQPDWNENNETSAAFVKNRTHYVIPGTETRTNTLTWDGDTTGKEAADSGDGILLVKVSDSVCTADDLIGGTVIMNAAGHEMSAPITAEMVRDMSSEGLSQIAVLVDGSPAVSIVTEDFSAEGQSVTKGIYFVYANFEGQTAYISSLIAVTDCFVLKTPETVKPLDGKFLPKGLGYIIKEGEQTVTNTLIWDGNIEGKEFVDMSGDGSMTLTKLTDEVTSAENLIGATMVLVATGSTEEQIVTITEDSIMDGTAEGMPMIMAVGGFNHATGTANIGIWIVLEDYSANGLTLTKGIWAVSSLTDLGSIESTVYVKSITALTDCFVSGTPAEVKKMDERLLPETLLATIADLTARIAALEGATE